METVLEILAKVKPNVDFKDATAIVDDGLLDSMDIVMLVGELNDEFDIEIQVTDLVPEYSWCYCKNGRKTRGWRLIYGNYFPCLFSIC